MGANGRISVPLNDETWRSRWPWAAAYIPGLGGDTRYASWNEEFNALLDFKGIKQQRLCIVQGPERKMSTGQTVPNLQLWVYDTVNPKYAYPWLTFKDQFGNKTGTPNRLIYHEIAENVNFMMTPEDKAEFERLRSKSAANAKAERHEAVIGEAASMLAKESRDTGHALPAHIPVLVAPQ